MRRIETKGQLEQCKMEKQEKLPNRKKTVAFKRTCSHSLCHFSMNAIKCKRHANGSREKLNHFYLMINFGTKTNAARLHRICMVC